MMEKSNFPIEFQTDITSADFDFYTIIEDRLNDLAKGHSDITGAAATLEQPAAGHKTPYIYEANIVVYVRPTNISATEKRETPELALTGALDAVERQVREKRNRLNQDRGSLDDLWLAGVDNVPNDENGEGVDDTAS